VVNYNYKSVSDHVFHPSSLYIPLVNQVTPSRKSTRVNYDKQNLKSNKKKKNYFNSGAWPPQKAFRDGLRGG
jgi:hypothetical protein